MKAIVSKATVDHTNEGYPAVKPSGSAANLFKSIQKGVVLVRPSDTTVSFTISAVNTSRAIIILGTPYSGVTGTTTVTLVMLNLGYVSSFTNSTTVLLTNSFSTGNSTPFYLPWTVVEFN